MTNEPSDQLAPMQGWAAWAAAASPQLATGLGDPQWVEHDEEFRVPVDGIGPFRPLESSERSHQ